MIRRLLIAVAVVGSAFAFVVVPSAQALRVRLPGGRFGGEQLRAGVTAAADTGTMTYHGGPVLHVADPYLVFWDPTGSGVATAARQLMERYLADAATDTGEAGDTYGVGRQYYDTSGIADAAQSFSTAHQVISDTQAYPAQNMSICPSGNVTAAYPTCITDAQVQSELKRLIAARSLPTGVGAGAPLYFVVTPGAVNVCQTAANCASNVFCGYHSRFGSGAGTVLYAVLPLEAITPDPKNCQGDDTPEVQEPNGNPADVIVDDLSHESNDLITDPLGSGWFDSASGNEVADNCEQYGATDPEASATPTDPDAYSPTLGGTAGAGTLYDQLINGHHYYTQTVWSNGNAGCEAAPVPATILPSFTLPTSAAAGQTVTFSPAASTSVAGFSSATWNFGDGGSTFTRGTPVSVSHVFAQSGTYPVTLALVDLNGNLVESTQGVTVTRGLSPSLTVAPLAVLAGQLVQFSGDGTQDGATGATVESFRWAFGDGTTGSGETTTHRYAKPGRYRVTLLVIDSIGLLAARTTVVQVSAPGRITATTIRITAGKPYLRVSVNAAGTVIFKRHTVKLRRPGTAVFRVKLTARQARRIESHRRVRLTLAVQYDPAVGLGVKLTRHLSVT